MRSVERAAAAGAQLGESPLWLPDRGVWLWLDLYGRKVWQHDPATGAQRLLAQGFAENLGCIARLSDDAVLVVSVRGFHRLGLDDGRVTPLVCPVNLPPGTIFNDGKVDRHGALWVGSSDAAEAEPKGSLWRVARGQVTEVAHGFTVSNGPAFAPDGRTAYFADTMARCLLAFPLDGDGVPGTARRFADLPEGAGYPDGMTVDSAGDLWVGHWDGARISRWSPDGRLVERITCPARNVTALAFGGADLCRALVTTAVLFPGQPETAACPGNGDLLSFRRKVPGLEEPVLAADWLD